MKSLSLKAFPRAVVKRSRVRKLRATGRVPAIIYGRQTKPQNLKVRALPRDLPEVITVDVTPLEIGQSIHLGEIPLPPGVEVIGDRKVPVISVAAPITEAQEAAALEAATTPLAEPEVLKEKKEEGAGEAAAGTTARPAAGTARPAAEKGSEKSAEKPAEKAEKKP